MPAADVLIFHRPAQPEESELVQLLARLRRQLAEQQAELFTSLGARARIVDDRPADEPFGQTLAALAPSDGGVVVLGSGSVPLLGEADARRLLVLAASGEPRALTNNRYSSDVCAVGQANVLRDAGAPAIDNSLPRWLAEQAGYTVDELPGRERLALDLDSPLDVALVALHRLSPRWLRNAARESGLNIPRLEELRAVAGDPHRELLIFGRSGSASLRWLERKVPCRVRFLAEERGLRTAPVDQRPARATLGRRLDERGGPAALSEVVAELADGALIDTRVLLADHFGRDERSWPPAGDRYASDLHRPAEVSDPWLAQLTRSAAGAEQPILLGTHSLVGPGVRLLLAGLSGGRRA